MPFEVLNISGALFMPPKIGPPKYDRSNEYIHSPSINPTDDTCTFRPFRRDGVFENLFKTLS